MSYIPLKYLSQDVVNDLRDKVTLNRDRSDIPHLI